MTEWQFIGSVAADAIGAAIAAIGFSVNPILLVELFRVRPYSLLSATAYDSYYCNTPD